MQAVMIKDLAASDYLYLAGRASSLDFERSLIQRNLAERLNSAAWWNLNRRDFAVFSMYFGINGYGSHTHQEIADIQGVTKTRIRQIIAASLCRLRRVDLSNANYTFRSLLGLPEPPKPPSIFDGRLSFEQFVALRNVGQNW